MTVHTIKAYTGSRGTAPPILTSALNGGDRSTYRPGGFTPKKEPPLHTEHEYGCAPQMGWIFWRREACFADAGIPIPDHPIRRYTDRAIPAPETGCASHEANVIFQIPVQCR